MPRRTLMLFSLLLLTATSLVMLPAAPTHAQDSEGFNFAEEKTQLWDWLADKHARWGDDYEDEELYVEALYEYKRTLFLMPEHKDAMRAFGYERNGDIWEKNEEEALPETNGIEGAAAKEEREKILKKIERFNDSAVKRLLKLADDCIDAGQEDHALIVYHEVIFYDPENERANEARGYVKPIIGSWIREVWKEYREGGDQFVEDASGGLEDTSADAQATTLGISLWRRYSDHFSVRSQTSSERARRLHKVALATWDLFDEIFVREDPVPFAWSQPRKKADEDAEGKADADDAEADEAEDEDDESEQDQAERYGRTYNILALNDHPSFLKFIDTYGPDDEKQREFQKRTVGAPMSDAFGYFVYESNVEFGDDVCSNQTARTLLRFYRPKSDTRSAEWIRAGLSYYITARLLGTTRTKYYTLRQSESGGRTRATKKKTDDAPEDLRNPNLGPDDFRAIIKQDCMFDEDIDLPTLAETGLNEMTEQHAAKSFSFFEFLVENHIDVLRDWLAAEPQGARDELNDLAFALDTTVGELDDAWSEWVLATY